MKWEEYVTHTNVEFRTEICLLRKITKSFDSKNAWGLFLSSRPTFLAFESIESELRWERYGEIKIWKIVRKKILHTKIVLLFHTYFELPWERE